jgi:hypothetical protein
MIKKIIKLFRKKKKKFSSKKELNSISGHAKKNIISFVDTLKKGKRIQTHETEFDRIDKIAVEINDNFSVIAKKSFLDMGKCYYIFLFRTLQSMIWSLSYPVYRHYFDSVRKQIVRNHKQLCHSFKEWSSSPSDQNLPGEKKTDEENETVH